MNRLFGETKYLLGLLIYRPCYEEKDMVNLSPANEFPCLATWPPWLWFLRVCTQSSKTLIQEQIYIMRLRGYLTACDDTSTTARRRETTPKASSAVPLVAKPNGNASPPQNQRHDYKHPPYVVNLHLRIQDDAVRQPARTPEFPYRHDSRHPRSTPNTNPPCRA